MSFLDRLVKLEKKIDELKVKFKITLKDEIDYIVLNSKKSYLDGRYTATQLRTIADAMDELDKWVKEEL